MTGRACTGKSQPKGRADVLISFLIAVLTVVAGIWLAKRFGILT